MNNGPTPLTMHRPDPDPRPDHQQRPTPTPTTKRWHAAQKLPLKYRLRLAPHCSPLRERAQHLPPTASLKLNPFTFVGIRSWSSIHATAALPPD